MLLNIPETNQVSELKKAGNTCCRNSWVGKRTVNVPFDTGDSFKKIS